MKKYLTIYHIEGDTSRFEKVTELQNVFGKLVFYYVSASTGERCYAEFKIENLAGFTYTVSE